MRIPGSRLAAVVLLSSLTVAACGSGEADLEDARAEAQEALDGVDGLRARIDDLESELAEARSDGRKVSRRLDRFGERLEQSVARLDASLAELEDSVTSAGGNAQDALGAAGEAARDIAVLSKRLDYHLRKGGDG